jgi:hypothetical protein
VAKAPYGAWLLAGSLRSGNAGQLAAADNSYLQVNAVQGQTSWYGRFSSVPNSLKTLTVTYTGVELAGLQPGRFGLQLDDRYLGRARLTSGGNEPRDDHGDSVRRTRELRRKHDRQRRRGGPGCVQRSDLAGYYTNADLLRIQYTP